MKAQTRLSAIAALAILSTVPTFASFELSLVTESGSNAIRRLDPENRVVLGSFGANNLNGPSALAVDQATGTVYVVNSYFGSGISRITALNYSTGAFINEWTLNANFQITSIAFRPGFGLYVPVNNGIRLYQTDGTIRATFAGDGLTRISSVSYSQVYNEVYAHDADGFTRYYNGATTSGTVSGFANANGLVNQVGFSAVNGLTSFGGNANTNDLVRFDHFSLSTATIASTPGFRITAVNAAHGNRMYAAGGTGSSESYITTFDQQGSQVSERWTVPGGTGIRSMATVVAPEPGTMIALSAGILALLRRKKSAK
jgi:DNA-binding beta-propeller fold protein YncE